MLSSPSASPSLRPASASASVAAAQGGLAPGAGLGKQRLWPPPNRSTHQSIHMRSSATPMPSNGPAGSPHAHVRAALDLSERTCASGGGAKEPVIRLGPSPRASSRPTLARRPPFLDSQQQALVPVPKMPAGSLGTATATADAVILPHHGHPHCSSTESGSPLVGVGMGMAYHWHRPIVLRELVSSLSPSPSPAHSPAPQPPTHFLPPPPPTSLQGHPLANPVHAHTPPHLQHARPHQHAVSMYRPPHHPPPPSLPAGVAAGTPTTTRPPPSGIFAPTPAPLPTSSPATAGKSKQAGVRARHTATTQSPSRSPAAHASSSAALPLPPRDAGGRWRRKADVATSAARPDPSQYSRPTTQLDPHSHPARKHIPALSTPAATATASHIGSPPLTPTSMLDASLAKPMRSTRPPTGSPPPARFSTATGAGGLVQLPPTHTRARTVSTCSSLSDAPPADRATAMQSMLHPTPLSSDELTDPASSSPSSDADAEGDRDRDISSDTCALCNRQSVPSPSKLPAIISQSPFPQPTSSVDSPSSTAAASTKKAVTHWAGCDFCPRWYHCACLGVPHRIVSKLAKLACPVCAAEHAHASKVKEKEAKRVADQVGAWVKQVYMARMAKGRPVTPASGKVKATKAKAAKRTRHRSGKQHMNDAGRDPEPVVAYAVSAPAGVTVYMDHGAGGGGPDPRLGQGHGDVIALPPLARRVRTRSVDKRKKQGSPSRFGARSQIRGHAVDGYVSFESGASAPATDVDSGSGSEADTDGECDDVVDEAEEELGQGQGDGAEVSECESTYSGSVCSSLFVAGTGYDGVGGGGVSYYDAHSHPHGFQQYSSALARRSPSPSEATEVEYSCPASPDGAHPLAAYHSHPALTFPSGTSPLETLLAAANVVAITDAATSTPSSSMDSSNPLASLASVASMMLLGDDHQEIKSEPSGHAPSDDTSRNKLLILADSAWASSLALGGPPASPTSCVTTTDCATTGQVAPHLPPTPVSASECDAGPSGADEGQRAAGLKRPRDDDGEVEGVACSMIVHADVKKLKTCDAEAISSLERMHMASMPPTSL